MEVIFIKDLRGQGKKGEIKKVKDGYGENFLINKGYALPVNEYNLKQLNNQKRKEAKLDQENIEKASITKKELETLNLKFVVKTGAQDKVFGSITSKQIKDKLEEKGFKIPKKDIEINNPITSLGYHEVIINLYSDIEAKIKIEVIK